MKRVLVFAFTMVFGLALSAQSGDKLTQTNPKTTTTTTTTKPVAKKAVKTKTTTKAHTCTAACKDGKHVYAHGETGHVCGDDCKKMMKSEKKMSSTTTKMDVEKAHSCTAACKDGKHVYVHGEKGHMCSADCKKNMSTTKMN